MKFKVTFLIVALHSLGSCSYVYDVRAEMIDGQLTFTSNKDWFRERCVREIDVTAENREDAAIAVPYDDQTRVGYGTYWSVRMDYHCENRFPLAYGAELVGRPDGGVLVLPKEFKTEIVYEVTTVTGATGYGGGRFILHTDGSVENLPPA